MTPPAEPRTKAGQALLADVSEWWDPDAPQEAGRSRFVGRILAIEAEAAGSPGVERVAALERALREAQAIVDDGWCTPTYHAGPCRDISSVLAALDGTP